MGKPIIYLAVLLCCNINSYCQDTRSVQERIAILDFQILASEKDAISNSWLSTAFAESLTDAFSRILRFKVIERSQLNKIIQEQKLQSLIYTDTVSVVRVGKLSGVKSVIVGSCQIYNGYLLVNMRMTNVETGEVYPIKEPRIAPIDSILFLQKTLCIEILQQFGAYTSEVNVQEIAFVTSESTKSMKAYEFLTKGVQFYENHQYEEAVDMYTVALEYDKKYSKAYYRRGLSNYALSFYEKAASDYSNSKNYLKKDSIYQLMGDAYFMQGMYKKSYECFKRAEKLTPSNPKIKEALKRFENLKIENAVGYDTHDSLRFDIVYEFNGGRAKVRSKNKYGFIDENDSVLVPIVFDDAKEYAYGLCAVKVGAKWGYIDANGQLVIEPIYSDAANFNYRGWAEVSIKDSHGVIDQKGRILIPIKFSRVYNIYNDSLFVVVIWKFKGSLLLEDSWGVYKITGEEILPTIYEGIDFRDWRTAHPYFYVKLDKKWGVVNYKNKIIVPFKYENKDCIRSFSNGYAAVKINEKWGFVNEIGLLTIEPRFERVNDFTHGFFEVKDRGRWGLLDTSFSAVIPNIYDKLEYIDKEFWAAKKGKYWGVITCNNIVVCDFYFDAMGSEVTNNFWYSSSYFNAQKLKVIVIKNNKKFWINEKCECIQDCK